ncbi:MAG TPA: TonB-dependent receptor [Thermoanaerobaculaceae bacterium]|nr:TonB-dependent receptor [Thermoanaerobaculaceae bacterium]HRS16605.1 TonB-dependent receptor [Thermoanaerobaculaceae bacterium]
MRRWFPTLLLLVPAVAAAAGWTVTGSVRDAVSGQPLPRASVRVAESGRVAETDGEGAFALEVGVEGAVTLAVSRPGYEVVRLRVQPGAAPLALALAPMVSFADRIEVTASRAREGADPASFTNVPRERIEEVYWGQDPAMLLAETVPGFYAYNDNGNGIGYSYFTVRGFGQARTRVTLNGAPLNDAESGELFFIDLADFLATSGDVQLRRGVYGLSGIGGALDITTAAPATEPSFRLHAGFGSFGTRRQSVRYDSGLVGGTWALSARYSRVQTDGYRDQSWVEQWNYFLSLARFGERSRLRLVLFGGPERTHLAYNGISKRVLDGGLTGNADRDRRFNPLTWEGEIDEFTQPHFQLLHEVSLGPSTELSQTFYAFQGQGFYDQFRTSRKLVEYNLPVITLPDGSRITRTDLVRRRNVSEWDWGWVPTFSHAAGRWTLTASGEVRGHRAHHFGEVRWAQHYPPGVPPHRRYYDYRVDKDTATASLGASYQVSPRLTLSAGLQGTRHRYEMSEDRIKGVAFEETYSFLLPRAGAVWRLGEGSEAYLAVARGMREPAFRTIYDPQDYWGTRVELDPEDVWDWEAGVSLRRAAWRLRANLFWMEFANEIVWAGKLDDSGVPVYGNGARSRHRGVELDGSWQPAARLGLDAAFTWSRNTFTDFTEYVDETTANVYDGNRIAGYPDVMAALTARTELAGVRLALSGRFVGRFFLDNTEDNRRTPAEREVEGYVRRVDPAFAVVDLSAAVPVPRGWTRAAGLGASELVLRVNNLLDRRYTAFGYVDWDGELGRLDPRFIPAATRSLYVGVDLGL